MNWQKILNLFQLGRWKFCFVHKEILFFHKSLFSYLLYMIFFIIVLTFT
nr:MAG TPA: hypothetical protein [Caudoviricetes sp.]